MRRRTAFEALASCRDFGSLEEINARIHAGNLERRRQHHIKLARRAVHTAATWRARGQRAEAAYWLNDAALERACATTTRTAVAASSTRTDAKGPSGLLEGDR